ncbi:MAG: recombination protein RecR [Pelagibacterales bacterium]|nr:recombination protein RecR [Pelagibacterales bacterium]OUU63244.1 MAG: recombination protein RecR [Alphaproteobacteria bacterium TMED62]|tara:strand:- start:2254 stop:2871 length:618 start_codon:yes stop_codon:yes gene_type:complete
MYSKEIDLLINLLSSLQGIGPRSARRIALQLIAKKNTLMMPLGEMITDVAKLIEKCKICGNYDSKNPCSICTNEKRDENIICIVEEVSDLWALERGRLYQGVYHVLGGTLDAIRGISPEKLNIDYLFKKVREKKINEIILATSLTTAGQTTAHYIVSKFKGIDIKITRLARGLPAGGELDYLDEATLSQALYERISVNKEMDTKA